MRLHRSNVGLTGWTQLSINPRLKRRVRRSLRTPMALRRRACRGLPGIALAAVDGGEAVLGAQGVEGVGGGRHGPRREERPGLGRLGRVRAGAGPGPGGVAGGGGARGGAGRGREGGGATRRGAGRGQWPGPPPRTHGPPPQQLRCGCVVSVSSCAPGVPVLG